MPCEEVEAKSASILHYSTDVEYILILKRALGSPVEIRTLAKHI